MYSLYRAPDEALFCEHVRDVDAEVRRVLATTTAATTTATGAQEQQQQEQQRQQQQASSSSLLSHGAATARQHYSTTTSNNNCYTSAYGGYASATALSPPLLSSALRAEVQRQCHAAVAQWVEVHLPAALAAVVDEHVSRLRDGLAVTTDALRRAHEQHERLTADVDALSRRCAQQTSALQTLLDRGTQTTRQRLDEVHEHVQRTASEVRAEMTLLKDTLAATQTTVTLSTQHAAGRLDTLARQHTEALHTTLAEVEARVRQWHAAAEGGVRAAVRSLQTGHDDVAAQVSQLQGGLEACAETVGACARELRALLEDSATQRAAVRACRCDVNRLEMLVQCCSDGGVTSPSLASAAACLHDNTDGDDAAADATASAAQMPSSSSLLPAGVMMQELLRSRERISFLAGQLSSVEQRLAALETRQPQQPASSSRLPHMDVGNNKHNGGGSATTTGMAHKAAVTRTVAASETATVTPPQASVRQQYVPAPTSDSESERENQHLSRLALD